MAFPLSYIVKEVLNEKATENSDKTIGQNTVRESKSLKRPFPFESEPDEDETSNILPEAEDVLDSIFGSLCSVSESHTSVPEGKGNFSPEVLTIYENLNVKTPPENEVVNCSSSEVIDLTENDEVVNETGVEAGSFEDLYDFTHIPTQVTGSWKEFTSSEINNYTRGCKWAPDGSCIMSCSEDNILRLFNLPQELWDTSKWQDISEMEAAVKISEGELIYDYCWYPHMNSSDPSTCCLASCSKNSPVHLWDAFTGELRCSYRSYDQMDEIAPPRSVSFDADGSRIFCGFEKTIRVFNVDTPGRNFTERKTFAKKSGQSGIISCFGFTPANRNVLAAGSYGKSIGLYAEPSGELECILEGQKGGVTQLQFSPDGNLLYSGGRKDPEILCWDMRNLGNVLYCLRRSCLTNQRMYFDISRCGRYVISGNHNGAITIWDTLKEPKDVIQSEFSILEPLKFYLAHDDCVNGISIHPTMPFLCSTSGQRKFPDLLPDTEDQMFAKEVDKKDNSLRLWWIGKTS